MLRLDLCGEWELSHCPNGEGSVDRISRLRWVPARVPGEVHWDLMRCGELPNAFFDLNHLVHRELEEQEFWYRRRFHVPASLIGERIELVFEGLDCFATVWLNGRLVGHSANALVPRIFDITDALRPGEENEIVVRLASPIKAVEGKDISGCAASFGTVERLWARKSDQCYGWDIAPRLVTVGIWRPVYIIAYSRAILRHVFVRAAEIMDGGRAARVVVEAEIETLSAAEESLHVQISGRCGESTFGGEAPVSNGLARMEIELAHPKLWWTWDLGEPNLYRVCAYLYEGPHQLGRFEQDVGLRVVRLVQEPEEDRERTFVFELNGERLFARGLNWTPCDAIYPRAEPWKQQRLVRFARALNCNMLRVWGGGIYEPDEFYQECDRQGIAVFHDFMYSCALYPQSDEFLAIARDEAEAAVRRLRNHACIVLWCGDNEVDVGYRHWYGGGRDPWKENRITRQVLPEVVRRLDGTRPYIPSSPHSPDPSLDPQDPRQGDQHIWHHGTPFTAAVYLSSTARFPSEIGHLSCPNLQTVIDMLAPEHRWPRDNRAWDEHFGSHYDLDFRPERREKLDQALQAWLGELPEDLPTYVLASQLLQGEAYKTWAEYWRLRKKNWASGGILLWNLADCWPQFSDAIVDFWLRPKLACNFVSWAYEPIHVCFSPPQPLDAPERESADDSGFRVIVYAINDTLASVTARWTVIAVDGDGKEIGRLQGDVLLPANEVIEIQNVTELARDAMSRVGSLRAELWDGDRLVSYNIKRFQPASIEGLSSLLADLPPLPCQP